MIEYFSPSEPEKAIIVFTEADGAEKSVIHNAITYAKYLKALDISTDVPVHITNAETGLYDVRDELFDHPSVTAIIKPDHIYMLNRMVRRYLDDGTSMTEDHELDGKITLVRLASIMQQHNEHIELFKTSECDTALSFEPMYWETKIASDSW